MRPFIKLCEKQEAGAERFDAYLGMKLVSCPALRTSVDENSKEVQLHMLSQIDFIRSLHNMEPPRVYALRYISEPNLRSFLAGTIEVCLMVKVSASSEANARAFAEYLFEETRNQLGSMLPEYSWRVVQDENEFTRLWEPFDIGNSYVTEIRRREGMLQLGTEMRRPSLARRCFSESDIRGAKEVYLVHQYIPRPSGLSRFLRVMLLHSSPLLAQVSLAPTALEESEEESIVEERLKCTKYLREETTGVYPAGTRPVSLRMAEEIELLLGSQQLRLQDRPFILRVALASPKPVESYIADNLGIEMTLPVGGGAPELYGGDAVQKGGYQVCYPENDDEFMLARRNIHELALEDWGPSMAPEGLQRLRDLVDAYEAAAAFRLPMALPEGIVGIEVQTARMRPIPRELASLSAREGRGQILLGENRYLGFPHLVFMPQADRQQHLYVVGQTGTGKTTLLKTMILSDIANGNGVAVIDPHGDLFEELLSLVPEGRLADVVILDPSDQEYPVGLNFLQVKDREDKHFIAREIRSIMQKLLYDQYGRASTEFAGPVFYQNMQNCLLLVMSDSENPGTILDFYYVFTRPGYYERFLPLKEPDNVLESFIEIFKRKGGKLFDSSDSGLSMSEYVVSKFEDFIFDPRLRMMFGQKRSTIDFGEVMNEGKILLVNLAKGLLTESNARFFGMITMAKLQAEAMRRISMPKEQRRPFYIYVDEFQSLITSNFTILLSEGRKFGIGLTLANQFVHQITDEVVREAIFGNVGSIICFRLGHMDSAIIEPHMLPEFDAQDLTNLNNYNACAKITVAGKVVKPFSLHTLLPDLKPNHEIAMRARDMSRKKYGRAREEVLGEMAMHDVLG